MSTLRYIGVCVMVLALVGGLVLRKDSSGPSYSPGNAENRNDVAAHGETQNIRPIASEMITAGRELDQLSTRIAQIESQIVRFEQQSEKLANQQHVITERLETQIARLEQQSQGLANQQDAMAEQWKRLSKKRESQAVISETDRTGDAAHEANEDALASERASIQQRTTMLEAELASQAPDPQWSSVAVEHITNVFNNESLAGSTLANLACATTLCRLEVIHSNQDSRDHFMDEIFPLLEWRTETYSHTFNNENGDLNTVLYLSREGYFLPHDQSGVQ